MPALPRTEIREETSSKNNGRHDKVVPKKGDVTKSIEEPNPDPPNVTSKEKRGRGQSKHG